MKFGDNWFSESLEMMAGWMTKPAYPVSATVTAGSAELKVF